MKLENGDCRQESRDWRPKKEIGEWRLEMKGWRLTTDDTDFTDEKINPCHL
jgi:hypothetical protein